MGIIENKGRLKMLDKMEVYYFSPTGGTKKVSSIFADAMEKEVIWHDLGSKEPMMEKMRKKSNKFAETVKNSTAVENVQVPGNRPYKPEMNMPVAPISLPSCTKCGKCVTVCPTNAISVADGAVITDIEKCILCMACTHICTEQARIRPLPLQQKTEQMLGALKSVRKQNEVFL